MRSLYIREGPLRRALAAHPQPTALLICKRRFAFKGRPEHIGKSGAETAAPKDTLLPATPARTRFAPSPTGYLHLGSLRTALYNYLLAKATGGQFLLRLEDTDQSRLVKDAEPRLYEDLKWAGLSWDEGPDIGGPFGPYKQSARLEIYNQHADHLLSTGQAYRCFCSAEELDALKLHNMEHNADTDPTSVHHYNGRCRHVSVPESDRRAAAGEPHIVRFRNTVGTAPVLDLVYGRYRRPEREDDFILVKRDGFPTYHFANVIDDHLMQVTHVVRGAEWLTSTPRHMMLYNAFQWTAPTFAHVGLLCNSQGQKLSKRSGDIDISSYRDKGILPAALLNYAVLLGWSPGRGQKGTSETMDLDEMIQKFHLRFTKGNIKISSKLPFLQSKHTARLLAALTPETFTTLFLPDMQRDIAALQLADAPIPSSQSHATAPATLLPTARDPAYLYAVFVLDKKAYDGDMAKLVARARYLLTTPGRAALVDSAAHAAHHPALNAVETVARFQTLLRAVPADQWTQDALEGPVAELCKSIVVPAEGGEEADNGPPVVWGYHVLRWILFAGQPGPALAPSLVVLGREEVLRRVDLAVEVARETSNTVE